MPLLEVMNLSKSFGGLQAVKSLMRDIDMPFTLREVGVREDKIPKLVEDSMISGAIPINPRKTTKEDVEKIFRKAL